MGYMATLSKATGAIVVTRPELVLETLEVTLRGAGHQFPSWLHPIDTYLEMDPAPGLARLVTAAAFVARDHGTTVTIVDYPEQKLSMVWPYLWDCLAYGVDTETAWLFTGEDEAEWVESLLPGRHWTYPANTPQGEVPYMVTDRTTAAEWEARHEARYGTLPRLLSDLEDEGVTL
jgi:hypothetical protein